MYLQNRKILMVFLLNIHLVGFGNLSNTDDGNIYREYELSKKIQVQIIATTDNICCGEKVQLEAWSEEGALNHSFTWTSNPEGFSASSKIVLIEPTVSTWYYLEVSDEENMVIAKDSIFIQVNPKQFKIETSTIPTSFNSLCLPTNPTNVTTNGKKTSSIHLYPNPNDGSFVIESEYFGQNQTVLVLYNSIGQVLFSETYPNGLPKTIKFDYRHLAKGLYFIKINEVEGQIFTEKIIIK